MVKSLYCLFKNTYIEIRLDWLSEHYTINTAFWYEIIVHIQAIEKQRAEIALDIFIALLYEDYAENYFIDKNKHLPVNWKKYKLS